MKLKHREIEQWAQGHTVHKQGGLDWSLGSACETLGSHLVTWYCLWPENGTISHPLLYQTKLFSELYFLHVLFPLSSPLRISTALCLTQIILILQSSLLLEGFSENSGLLRVLFVLATLCDIYCLHQTFCPLSPISFRILLYTILHGSLS